MTRRPALEDTKALHLELTSKCNAACAFCSRRQKVRPYGNPSLSLADIKLLPRNWLEGLRRIHFGGNFGDFCCNHQAVEIAAYLRRLNICRKLVLKQSLFRQAKSQLARGS